MKTKLLTFYLGAIIITNLLLGCNNKELDVQIQQDSNIKHEIVKHGIPQGIIGAIDIQQLNDNSYPEVNFLQVVNAKKKLRLKKASGTRLRDKNRKRDFILTVKHLLNVDIDENDIGELLLFIGSNGLWEEGEWYKFTESVAKYSENNEPDIILIPVKFDSKIAAFDINDLSFNSINEFPHSVSIVSALNLNHWTTLKKVKQNANLRSVYKIGTEELYQTDADALTGLSGSPVFNDYGKILGILSRGTRKNDCSEYNKTSCYSGITPISEKILNLTENPKEYFRPLNDEKNVE